MRDVDAALAALSDLDGPWVVKPTRGASSDHVLLAHDGDAVKANLSAIRTLAFSRAKNFYEGVPDVWALIEEYLPGDEVTCDGVVIDGQFYLGGIHGKDVGQGPWFEEDLYTLPLLDRSVELNILGITEQLVTSLDMVHALFNVELRCGADGHIVSWSSARASVAGTCTATFSTSTPSTSLTSTCTRCSTTRTGRRDTPAGDIAVGMATCVRAVYRTGVIKENCAGPAANDGAFRAYYPIAAVGQRVASAPVGFDMCGQLSVRERLDPHDHPQHVQATARRLEQQLALRVE